MYRSEDLGDFLNESVESDHSRKGMSIQKKSPATDLNFPSR